MPKANAAPPASATALPPASLTDVLDEIALTTVMLRGLEPLWEVDRNMMTRTQLAAFLREKLEEDRENLSKQQEVLAVLDLVPEGMDLYQLYLDLYGEQVLGLYDTDTDKLYVISEQEHFGPNEEATFAHEYVHALQQQHFDIHSLDEEAKGNSDARAALRGLIEGDATVQQFQYIFDSLVKSLCRPN